MRIGTKDVSLKSIATFEAVGRHLSMRRAAEDLSVTPSAVSHQIRALEQSLGLTLFDRRSRKLSLSDDGRRLFETVRHALEGIAATTLQLGNDAFTGSISIAAPPSFSTQWLLPRLVGFLEAFPDLSVTCSTLPSINPPVAPDADVAIVFGQHAFPGRVVDRLVELDMFPVCAPGHMGDQPVLSPDDLRDHTLIHEDQGALWAAWFEATGTEQFKPKRSIFVASAHDALALAGAGGGIAINDSFMGSTLLQRGALIRPFGAESFRFGSYSMVTSTAASSRPPVQAFKRWLVDEVSQV